MGFLTFLLADLSLFALAKKTDVFLTAVDKLPKTKEKPA